MITLAETASYTVTVYCMYMYICNGNCNLHKCHQSYSDTESAGFPCLIRENFTLEGEHDPAKKITKPNFIILQYSAQCAIVHFECSGKILR